MAESQLDFRVRIVGWFFVTFLVCALGAFAVYSTKSAFGLVALCFLSGYPKLAVDKPKAREKTAKKAAKKKGGK